MPTESITLYFREGNSDKIYQTAVTEKDGGFVVNFAFGRRGSTLQTGTKTNAPVSFEAAKKIFDKLVKEKTAKGYAPGANGTPYSGNESAQRSTGILPQLLNPVDEAQAEQLIADPLHWMQQKLDGKRVIIQALPEGKIVGINRGGLTIDLPESIQKAAAAIDLPFTIDGEAIGDTFHAFDLMEFNGSSLRASPYRVRYEMLACLLKKCAASIKLVPAYCTPATKREAFDRLKQENAEGVVFKLFTAPYTPGRPASAGPQLKFKFVATGSFIVAGVNAGRRSVGLEALNESGKSVYVGNVTIGVIHKVPAVGAVVEIRYLYAFREGCLFQPLFLGVRDDIDAKDCTMAQLKFRPEENDDGE